MVWRSLGNGWGDMGYENIGCYYGICNWYLLIKLGGQYGFLYVSEYYSYLFVLNFFYV